MWLKLKGECLALGSTQPKEHRCWQHGRKLKRINWVQTGLPSNLSLTPKQAEHSRSRSNYALYSHFNRILVPENFPQTSLLPQAWRLPKTRPRGQCAVHQRQAAALSSFNLSACFSFSPFGLLSTNSMPVKPCPEHPYSNPDSIFLSLRLLPDIIVSF